MIEFILGALSGALATVAIIGTIISWGNAPRKRRTSWL